MSSIMNDVGPFSFVFLVDDGIPSDFYLASFDGESRRLLFDLPSFVGDPAKCPFLGPFSLLFLTYFTAYSLVKQSHIPSQATIIKSCSGFIETFFMSG